MITDLLALILLLVENMSLKQLWKGHGLNVEEICPRNHGDVRRI